MRFICIAAFWKKYGQVATHAAEDQPVCAEMNLICLLPLRLVGMLVLAIDEDPIHFFTKIAAPAKPNRFDIKTFADKLGWRNLLRVSRAKIIL